MCYLDALYNFSKDEVVAEGTVSWGQVHSREQDGVCYL